MRKNLFNPAIFADFLISLQIVHFQPFRSIEKHSFYHEYTTIKRALI